MTTIASIHGHEIMHLLLDKGPLSREELQRQSLQLFGAEAKFHTCSASGMDLAGLLQFLLDRNKIQEGPQGLYMQGSEHICSSEK